MRENAIVVNNLKKSYKNHEVLKGVDFTVERGSIFALLGSNGAGKTTTVNILSTLMDLGSGEVDILGYDLTKQATQVRENISLTGQYAAVDENLTGYENRQIIASLRNIANKNQVAKDLLESFGLSEAANKLVFNYSGGMRRRLDIAMSLIGNPAVIFLDEPTTGLDPQNRLAMWEIVKSMADSGTTVFLTTQYLDEAEYLADHIAVLHEGVIIADGTSKELKEKLPQGIIQLSFKDEADLNNATKLLSNYKIRAGEESLAIDVQSDGSSESFANVLNILNQNGVNLVKFAPKQPTLEDAFLTLIGEKEEV